MANNNETEAAVMRFLLINAKFTHFTIKKENKKQSTRDESEIPDKCIMDTVVNK